MRAPRLTDSQFGRVQDAARRLPPGGRDMFLRAVAEQLRGYDNPGDGDVNRALRAVLGDMQGLRASWLSPED